MVPLTVGLPLPMSIINQDHLSKMQLQADRSTPRPFPFRKNQAIKRDQSNTTIVSSCKEKEREHDVGVDREERAYEKDWGREKNIIKMCRIKYFS